MADQVEYFETEFATLVDKACHDVRKRDLEPSIFLSRVTTLRVSDRTHHRSFIQENLINIPPPVTFDKIWSRLTIYWDFMNYGLLKHVINELGSEDLKHQMQVYVQELSTFKSRTLLCDFIDSWPCKDNRPSEDELKKIVIKMKHEWTKCTLQDVESFRTALIHKFFLPEFEIILQNANKGCVCVTWLTSPSTATLLQQNLANIETEFFTEHKIEAVTIDGQDCYPTPISGYLTEQDTSEQPAVDISPPMPAEKFHPQLKQDSSEEGTVARHVHEVSTVPPSESQQLGDPPHVSSTSGYPGKHTREIYSTGNTSETSTDLSEEEAVVKPGKPLFEDEYSSSFSSEIQQLGDPLHASSTSGYPGKHTREIYSTGITSETLSEEEAVVKPGKPLFEHEYSSIFPSEIQQLGDPLRMPSASAYLKKLQRERFTSKTTLTRDLLSPTTAEEYVKQKAVDEVPTLAKLLPSVEEYLSKAEVEEEPSLPTKYRDYLSSTPAIRAAMYTPFIAKTSAEVFTWSQLTGSPPPTTMTELFTAFTLKTLVGYLSTHPLYCKQQLKVTSFSDLPPDVYKQFLDLCRMAYEGILNRQQLVFSAAHLPTGFSPLGLMQEVHTQGEASFHFTHLTLQEFLSAIHISQLTTNEQMKLIQDHLDSGHFKMTLRFVAGLTKLSNVPPEITRKLREERDNSLSLLHWLFECNDTSVTTRTLGSGEMVVRSHYFWTPLDYYVTGHVISHSNCPWALYLRHSSIDDDKFELFCQGCATHGGTGYISYADFSYNDITTKHMRMQSFVSIPPHILQGMRMLNLSGNKLDGRAYDLLAKVVPSMARLEVLWLVDNLIGSGGAVEMIKSLSGSGVKELWLYNTGIGGPDCEALSELLQSTHLLDLLHIDQNNLSSESVASIITGLSHNNSLRTLDISDSHFSMANRLHLSSLLREHSKCTLTDLRLRDCHSSEGAVELATALCKNTTLRELNLSGNPIGEHANGVTAVATMLVENKSLTSLWLEDCHISGQGAGELAAALYKNLTLQHLTLNRNPIGVKGASSMSDMLQHNTSLTQLWLCDDSVGEEGVHQLMNSVKYNQTLRELQLSEKYKSETSDHRINWW